MDLVQPGKIRTRILGYPLYRIEIEKEGRISGYRVETKKENEYSDLDCKNKSLSKRARHYLLVLGSLIRSPIPLHHVSAKNLLSLAYE